ncbi:MAG: ATP-binding protein [Eubacteriales bacterium]|nr:ATP-binding protein [Eubacteriales bacterium]
MKRFVHSMGFLNHLGDTAACVLHANTREILYCNERMSSLIPGAETGKSFCALWGHHCDSCPFISLKGDFLPYLELPLISLPTGQRASAFVELFEWDTNVPAYVLTLSAHEKKENQPRIDADQQYLSYAMSNLYPVIYLFNYTQDTYRYLNFKNPRINLPDTYGTIQDLIDYSIPQVHPSYRDFFIQALNPQNILEACQKDDTERTFQFRYLMTDGKYHWLTMMFLPVENLRNDDSLVLGICRSLDDEKKSEELLLSDQRALLDTLPGGTAQCLITRQPVFLSVSSKLKMQLGIQDHFFLSEIVRPDYRGYILNEIFSMAERGADISLELPILGHSNQVFWMILVGKKIDTTEEGPIYQMVMIDISSHHDTCRRISQEQNMQLLLSLKQPSHSNQALPDDMSDDAIARHIARLQEAQKTVEKSELNKRRSAQRFILAVSDLYEAIYEADLYQNTIHAWKEGRDSVSFTHKYETLEQLFQAAYQKHVHPDYRKSFKNTFFTESMKKAFESGKQNLSLEYPSLSPSGQYEWVSTQAQLLSKSASSMEVMIYIKNIAAERAEELRQQTASLESIQLMQAIHTTYDILVSVNLTKNSYSMVNNNKFLNKTAPPQGIFDNLILVEASTVPKRFRSEFIKKFDRQSLLQAYEDGYPSVYLEHQQMGEDGLGHWVSTHVMFTRNPYNDDVMGITLIRRIDDLRATEEKNRKILEDALMMAEQANKAKSDFLSRMSHDIRSPMNAIIGMTTIAKSNLQDVDRVRECLDKISSSSQYLLALINDILDFSRIESGKISINHEPFELQKMLKSLSAIVSVQTLEKGQFFQIISQDDLQQSYVGDELRLKQILMNLLGNAHKYTPSGGRISLEISAKKQSNCNTILRFSVRDTGSGIAPEFLSDIFNPFSQGNNANSNTGSGLGLAITKNLVNLMNGHISLTSQLGKGSCFTVEIPLENYNTTDFEPEKWIENIPDEADSIQFQGEKILLAEDNTLNQEVAVTILEMHHLSVDVASNGQEALEIFEASAPRTYLAILMDIQMPVMNGYEAAAAIRSLDRKDAQTTPIYAMTANSFARDVSEALACGMNGHIAKPVDFEYLIKILFEKQKAAAHNLPGSENKTT